MILLSSQLKRDRGQGPERSPAQDFCPVELGRTPLLARGCTQHSGASPKAFRFLWRLHCVDDGLSHWPLVIDLTSSPSDLLVLEVSETPLISWGKPGRRRRWVKLKTSQLTPLPTLGPSLKQSHGEGEMHRL